MQYGIVCVKRARRAVDLATRCDATKGMQMSERTLDPRELLPEKPFEHGMASAFDLYGVLGRQRNERIWNQWRRIVDQPRKTADEAVRDEVRLVSSQFRNLISEQKQ